jgi:hypothetical protein
VKLKTDDMSKPKQLNPYLPEAEQPMMECHTCDNWRTKRTDQGAIDYGGGSCPAKGLSSCPARHVCSGWIERRHDY